MCLLRYLKCLVSLRSSGRLPRVQANVYVDVLACYPCHNRFAKTLVQCEDEADDLGSIDR
jgi:hypothetical protein